MMLSFYPSKSHSFQNPKNFFPQLPENRVLKFCPELEHYLVPYSASAVMALVWQMYRLPVNLPNFSSCFSKLVHSSRMCLNFYHNEDSKLEGFKLKNTHVGAMFWLEAKLVVCCGQK